MAQRAGSANLPLHGGRVPPWLGQRMTRLGALISEAIVQHYGRDELLRRLAHPFWFQSFGAVMGMDWHSSGITTSVIGALKRGLTPLAGELGIHVCGGRGAHSRKTPDELIAIGERTGFDGGALAQTSRLVAKVDSAAVQDGFDLYLHGFIVTDDGSWVVVQQGMNGDRRLARRYHWKSEGLESFLDSPHAAIEGREQGEIVNLADRRAAPSRRDQLTLLSESGPDAILRELARLSDAPSPKSRRPPTLQPLLPYLDMPAHHDVRPADVVMRRLHRTLAAAADRGPKDFSELLLVPGVGQRTVKALAMVAEVVHGAPCRFSDPARFSFAHGGKDRHPFPVPLKVYDETIRLMKSAVEKGRLGRDEELAALKRLDDQARQVERYAKGPDFGTIVSREFEDAPLFGGRSVFGWEKDVKDRKTRA
ncbi:DUF763 domain-containing protein [Chelatococcus asaccharovorans]|uniref:DUF763 domain-containing protein n=1 Tax=Chelatococcus asaccharovorans TaxID=28210 RepID=UPI00224C76A8|nr:DUF763 domain-containing protein [Chelatococcus asaccharovorans]CAH1663103.1 conserved hypothetical protein [Chelatococcus asaccharovorans]CAH1682966.1 conserved hypothetical protein [Chelatococcus asaccharovorans]